MFQGECTLFAPGHVLDNAAPFPTVDAVVPSRSKAVSAVAPNRGGPLRCATPDPTNATCDGVSGTSLRRRSEQGPAPAAVPAYPARCTIGPTGTCRLAVPCVTGPRKLTRKTVHGKAGLNRARVGLAIDWTCAHAVDIEARQAVEKTSLCIYMC
jgi:hypothetical protein